MKKRTRTASAAELKRLKPKKIAKGYNFTLQPEDVFNVTINGRQLNFSGQTFIEAIDLKIQKEEEETVAALKEMNKSKAYIMELDPEFNSNKKVLTDEVKANMKASFNNPIKTPKRLLTHNIDPDDQVKIKIDDDTTLTISGREILDATEVKDQVDNLRKEAEALTNWKNEVLIVLKKWNDVQDYIMKKGDAKMLGRNVSEIVLERLKDYDHFIGKMKPQQKQEPTNGREFTPEEIAKDVFEKMSGRDGMVPEFLNLINSSLIERLGNNAMQAKDAAAIATKRFEESLAILNNLKAGAGGHPTPKIY